MHKLIAVAIVAAYLIRTLRFSFYLVFLWQKREYRLDRMLSHLKTPLGKKLLFGKFNLIKWLLFVIFVLVRRTPVLMAVYYLFWFFWLIEALLDINELRQSGWKLPRL